MPTRAAVYCRISRDPRGDLLGVQRQEPPCRELCERLGWEVVEVYTDDDISAYNGKHRPAYQRMLDDLRVGRVNAIVAWAADRLTRRPVENEAIIDLAERLGVKLATVSGEYDLATPSGRLHFRQLGIIARYESEHRAERLRLKHEQLARAGKLNGSGTRPFGYEQDRLTICETEATLIREAVQRLLAGESVRTVIRDWNARGITTSAGRPWSNSTFVRMIRAPRIAGKRAHHGVVVADAVWQGIITPSEQEQLLAVLDGNAKAWGSIVRRYLLTGFLVCGRCGAKLIAQPRMDGVRSYACAVGAGRAGCGRTTRLAEPLEAYVRDAVIAALDSPELLAALDAIREETADDAVDGLLDRLRATETQLEDLGRDYADGLVIREAFFAAQARLSDRLEVARRQLSQAARRRAVVTIPDGGAAAVRAEWDAWGDNESEAARLAGLERRRALLGLVLDRVILHPCVRGRRDFDPSRVELVWRV
jgi:DNA invertase Pin-like site-specific DNA recombinase